MLTLSIEPLPIARSPEPIGQSTLALYVRCPRKWHYAVERGLHPRGGTDPMKIGTLFHVAAAAGNHAIGSCLLDGQSPERAFTGPAFVLAAETAVANADYDRYDRPIAASRELHQLAFNMSRFYHEHVVSKERYVELISAEDPVTISCAGLVIRVTLDAAWRAADQQICVRELKTVVTVKNATDFLPLDFQRRAYEYAAVMTYGDQVNVQYDFMRREVPPGYGSRPLRINKNGSVSKTNASQDPADYVWPVPLPRRSKSAVLSFEREVREYVQSIRMHRAAGVWPRVRIKTGGDACTQCPYFLVCHQELDGHDVPHDALRSTFDVSPLLGTQQPALVA